MKTSRVFIIWLIIASVFISCSTDGDNEVERARTAEDVVLDFQNLNLQPGINDINLESLVNGVFWNFRVIIPENAAENNKRPLVIDLHGASGGNANAHKNTDCYVEKGVQALNAFIISPNAGFDQWYDQSNQQLILALVDLASSYWHVNPNKRMITGYSNGGNGSWFFADYYPELFSVAVPIASSYDPERSTGEVPRISVPMYVIHGENDELFPVEQTETFVNKSIAAGSSIEFVVAPGLTHLDVCDYESYLEEASAWILSEIWN